MLHHVALVGTDGSEECITSIIRVTRIGELGTLLAVTSPKKAFFVKHGNCEDTKADTDNENGEQH
jgi:hypothetical protein